MTREAYERHLSTLGSWAELLPPWPVVEEAMSELVMPNRHLERWKEQVTDLARQLMAVHQERDRTKAIARALLAETGLTPSEVRSRWPEDAEWLLT